MRPRRAAPRSRNPALPRPRSRVRGRGAAGSSEPNSQHRPEPRGASLYPGPEGRPPPALPRAEPGPAPPSRTYRCRRRRAAVGGAGGPSGGRGGGGSEGRPAEPSGRGGAGDLGRPRGLRSAQRWLKGAPVERRGAELREKRDLVRKWKNQPCLQLVRHPYIRRASFEKASIGIFAKPQTVPLAHMEPLHSAHPCHAMAPWLLGNARSREKGQTFQAK